MGENSEVRQVPSSSALGRTDTSLRAASSPPEVIHEQQEFFGSSSFEARPEGCSTSLSLLIQQLYPPPLLVPLLLGGLLQLAARLRSELLLRGGDGLDAQAAAHV